MDYIQAIIIASFVGAISSGLMFFFARDYFINREIEHQYKLKGIDKKLENSSRVFKEIILLYEDITALRESVDFKSYDIFYLWSETILFINTGISNRLFKLIGRIEKYFKLLESSKAKKISKEVDELKVVQKEILDFCWKILIDLGKESRLPEINFEEINLLKRKGYN